MGAAALQVGLVQEASSRAPHPLATADRPQAYLLLAALRSCLTYMAQILYIPHNVSMAGGPPSTPDDGRIVEGP
jgi:hypothetical protein